MTIDIEYQKLKQLYFDNESNLDNIKTFHAKLLTDLKTKYDNNEISIYWRKWDTFKTSIEKRKRNKKRQLEQEEEKKQSKNQKIEDESFETLSKLVIELKQTEFNLNNGDYVIKEYCNELKRKVQLGKEIKIEKCRELSEIIENENQSEQMMSQIKNFEQEKLAFYLKAEKDAEFISKLNEMKEKLRNYNDKLNNLKNEKQIISNHEILNLLSQQMTLNENFISLLFDSSFLQFCIKENKKSFGEVFFRNFNKIDLKKNDNKIEMSKYVNYLKHSDPMKYYTELRGEFCDDEIGSDNEDYISTNYVRLNDNKYVIFYYVNADYIEGEKEKIFCFLYNSDHTFIKSKLLKIKYNHAKTCISNGEKIVFDFDNKIIVLNKELEIIANLTLVDDQHVIEVNDSFIFTTCEKVPLIVYDFLFNLIKEIGQKINSEQLFYLPRSIINLKTKNNYYYVLEIDEKDHYLKIMDQKTGNILKEIKIIAFRLSLLFIDSSQRLIFGRTTHCDMKMTCSLVFMSQNGDFLKEITIDEWMVWQNWSIDQKMILHGHVYKMKSRKYKIGIQENDDHEDESFEELDEEEDNEENFYYKKFRNILIKSFELLLQ